MEEILNTNMHVSRSCSYCRSTMHNIRGCNSLDIDILSECHQQAFLVIRQSNTRFATKDLYTNWLLHTYNLQQLKVVAVTRMNSRISGLNKADYAEKIWYINNCVYEDVEDVEEVGWSIDRLPNANPEITFNTNTIPLVGFQTPPTMSPRIEPPEIERQNNVILDSDDELLINSHNGPQIGFGYIPSFVNWRSRRATFGNGSQSYVKRNKNISIKKQELIGLSELLGDDFECSICYETQNKSMKLVLGCNHEFCTECIIKMLKTSNKPRCAFCRDEMKEFIVYNNEELNKLEDYCIVILNN